MNTKYKLPKILFCFLFISVCAFFSAGRFIPGSESVDASEKPALVTDGRVSESFGDDFESWFSENFAFRDKAVIMYSAIREKLFGTGRGQVIAGDDGFLFFEETTDAYTGRNPMTDDEIASAVSSVINMSEYARANGAGFLLLVAPDKNTVYPEKMPARYKQCDVSDLDRLYAALEGTGVRFIDVRTLLSDAKNERLVYHKRDTHWNGLGARLVHLEVMKELNLKSAVSMTEPETVHDFDGDLDALLYPGLKKYDDDYVFSDGGEFAYVTAYSTEMDMIIKTRSYGEAGRLLMFRDSFANALISDFASSFAEAVFERAIPFRINQAENGAFDVIIVEIAERNIRNLIDSDSLIK